MSTREFIRTIRNKIRFLAGITRSKIDAGKDTIGDLHNFKMEMGSLVLREGTRVMNSKEDQLWYDIQSFTISGTNILIGINYKRELWAWLEKWAEIDFKLCTSSPYKRYRHVDDESNEVFNRHISFSKGDNFWLDQDAYTITIMSDQGEIYKIMKQGFVRITKDIDYVESGDDESISDLVKDSREYNFETGRIYVDIKDATNRVFEEKLYLPEDTQRRGHRITGEVRAAWVNELGVVSELSDPEYLAEYRHVMASLVPILEKDVETGEISASRYVKPSATTTAKTGSRIYRGQYDTSGNTFSIDADIDYDIGSYPGYEELRAYAVILVVTDNGKYVPSAGTSSSTIPNGAYMCFCPGYTLDNSSVDAGQIFEASMRVAGTKSAIGSLLRPAEMNALPGIPTIEVARPSQIRGVTIQDGGSGYSVNDYIYIEPGVSVDQRRPAILQVVAVNSGVITEVEVYDPGLYIADGLPVNPVSSTGGNGTATFNLLWETGSTAIDMIDKDTVESPDLGRTYAIQSSTGEWIKLDNSIVDRLKTASAAHWRPKSRSIRFTASEVRMKIDYFGELIVVNPLRVLKETSSNNVIVHPDIMVGLEFPLGSDIPEFRCNSFDLWEYKGTTDFSPSDIDIVRGKAVVGNLGNLPIQQSTPDLLKLIEKNDRFAVWNNSNIIGVSQRCFYSKDNQDLESIVYRRKESVDGNFNLRSLGVSLSTGCVPFMRLDYMGRRKVPYPMPLISRAMRNPEKALISAGNIYSLEEGKLWYGSSSDMLLRDSIEFQATVKDMCPFDIGVIAATERGLQFVSKGGYQTVYRGERVTPDYLSVCSGGAIAIQNRKIFLVHKVVTDDGSWYPQATEIGQQISGINLEGSIKSASIGNVIYIADDHNVWGYDLDAQSWSLKYSYDTKIHKLFVFNHKLGLSFDAQIDRSKSFDAPEGIGAS